MLFYADVREDVAAALGNLFLLLSAPWSEQICDHSGSGFC